MTKHIILYNALTTLSSTNCLVRGGACGYPSQSGDSALDSNGEASGDSSELLAADPGHALTSDFDLDLENIDPGWSTLGDFDFDVDTLIQRGAYIDAASSDFQGYDYFDTLALPQSVDLSEHCTIILFSPYNID